MSSNTLPQPQFDLPRPLEGPGNEVIGANTGETDSGKMDEQRNIEQPATAGPIPPAQASQAVSAASAAITAPSIPANPASAGAASAGDIDLSIADDNDLIEKSWVDRAKAIVDQTRNDPHRQNTEINKVKKEYIQKRYHKDIKLNNE